MPHWSQRLPELAAAMREELIREKRPCKRTDIVRRYESLANAALQREKLNERDSRLNVAIKK